MASDEKPSGRPLSRITVPVQVLDNHKSSFETIDNHPDLTPSERRFLNGIVKTGIKRRQEGETPDFDVKTFQGSLAARESMSISHSRMRHYLSTLSKKGFLQKLNLMVDKSYPSARPKEYRVAELHAETFKTVDEQQLHEELGGRRSERTSDSRKILRQLQESNAQLAAFNDNSKDRTDNIWTGLADRVLRFSAREHPVDNEITTKVNMFGVPLILQTTTLTGPSSEIATLQDQRVIRAIISIVADTIDKRKEKWYQQRASHLLRQNLFDESGALISDTLTEEEFQDLASFVQNSFYVDVTLLGQKLGYATPWSGATRKSINQSIRRLYETNFRLKIESTDENDIRTILRRYDLNDIVNDFRFITDLTSQYSQTFLDNAQTNTDTTKTAPNPPAPQTDTNESIRNAIDPYQNGELLRVRLWDISIDNHLYRRMLRDTRSALFTAHPGIMRESSGLGQTLYNWASHVIGRTDPTFSGKTGETDLALSVIHKTLWPWRYYARFEEKIVQIMRHYISDSEFDPTLSHNVALMWGYVWSLYRSKDNGELRIHVRRNLKDPLTGDDSFPNRKHRHIANATTASVSPALKKSGQSSMDL